MWLRCVCCGPDPAWEAAARLARRRAGSSKLETRDAAPAPRPFQKEYIAVILRLRCSGKFRVTVTMEPIATE